MQLLLFCLLSSPVPALDLVRVPECSGIPGGKVFYLLPSARAPGTLPVLTASPQNALPLPAPPALYCDLWPVGP